VDDPTSESDSPARSSSAAVDARGDAARGSVPPAPAKERRAPRLLILGLIALLALGAGGGWWASHRETVPTELTLHGNVDLRQVELPFNNSGRIDAVLAEEGDRVRKGQLLARLDTSRLRPQVAQAQANVAAQEAVVARLHHGSRPEEIAQARANVALAEANANNARAQYRRLQNLDQYASRQDVDNARAAMDVAAAQLAVNRKALDLAVIGPRAEDIAQAQAQLQADQAQLALLRQQLDDAELLSPIDGVVRARLLEAGEMASPQLPVFTLAMIDPKWVRAYVGETELGRVRLGMPASVTVDSFPGKRFDGWVGFVSPVSEFTPKSVQTEDLRTSLVYEVRVFVHDPDDALPLGAPATVHLPLSAGAGKQQAAGSATAGTSGRAR
jgi:HlyD family secretion protein